MLPFIKLTSFSFGPVTIHVWGLLISLGFLFAMLLASREAKRRGLKQAYILDATVWIFIFAMLGARLFFVLFYNPGHFINFPLDIFRIWLGGWSMLGGIFGAFTGFVLFARKRKISFWKYADVLAFALPLGIGVGRLGCAAVHDHPGRLSNFFLAFQHPGGARHDLGFYLSLNGFILLLIFLFLNRKERFAGFYLSMFAMWYGVTRFLLDFLRAVDGPIVDVRYFGLTPAQYAAIVILIFGIVIYKKRKNIKTQELESMKTNNNNPSLH